MFIKSIHLKNILSFGENTPVLELQDLNILIGANGSGKSNLIDVIEVLKNEHKQAMNFIRKTGGVQSWLFKKNENDKIDRAEINCKYVTYENYEDQEPIKYEANINIGLSDYNDFLNYGSETNGDDPVSFHLSIFRDWTFGRFTNIRKPQESDAPKEFLQSDFSNLNLVLSEICSYPKSQEKLLKALKKMNEDFDDLRFAHPSGWIELFLFEGEKRISAKRLSDGTLRYLCLLAILCHPNPPPLICIEEPELGFHPDLLPTIAELLKDASTRTQLIVTTHSDILIDCFSETPEAVIVFDKVEGSTTMTRLSRDDLKHWMDKKFSLGKHWLSGQIGGLRY